MSHINFKGQTNGCHNDDPNIDVHAMGVSIIDRCYVSRLTIAVRNSSIGENVMCQYDNVSVLLIGQRTLTTPAGKLIDQQQKVGTEE